MAKRDRAREKGEKATKDKGKVEIAAYRRSVPKPMKVKKK